MIKDKLLRMLQEINPYEDIMDETLLVHEGILDSLTLVIFMNEIEQEFDIQIPEDKLQPEFFDNINRIVELIEMLQKGKL